MNKQMILNLIRRDFRAYQTQIMGISFISLVMGMLMIFVNTHLDRMFASGANSFIFIAIIVPFIPELKSKSIRINTASLPVTRKAIVTARFLISLSIVTVNLLIWVIVFMALMNVLNSDPQYAIGTNEVIIVGMNLLINLSLFYFAYYRFNFFVAIGFYLFAMITPQIIITILSRTKGFIIEDFEQTLGMSLLAIGMFILSFLSSWFHFQKKDL